MDGNPIMAALVIGVLAGAGGFVLFTVLPEAYRAARIPVTIVAALMGAMNGCTHFGEMPPGSLSSAEAERRLMESDEIGEVAAAFKQADPLGFAAYLEHARTAMGEGEGSEARVQAAITLQAAAEQRLSSRPVEDIVTYYELRRDELLEMRDASPASCRPIFFGGEDVDPVPLSPALSARRMALSLRAFGALTPTPHEPLSDAEFDAAVTAVFARAAEAVGPDADLLNLDTSIAGREARSCEVLAEVANQFAQSPDAARIYATTRQRPAQPT